MAGKNKPLRRYRQFKDRRLEILRSAASAFTRSGFAHATMEDIADKVQMAKGNLYYYLPTTITENDAGMTCPRPRPRPPPGGGGGGGPNSAPMSRI